MFKWVSRAAIALSLVTSIATGCWFTWYHFSSGEQLFSAWEARNRSEFSRLISIGANPDATWAKPTLFGESILVLDILRNGNLDYAEELFNADVNLRAIGNNGVCVLHLLVKIRGWDWYANPKNSIRDKRIISLIKKAIEEGAPVNARDSFGHEASYYAGIGGYYRILKAAGASEEPKFSSSVTFADLPKADGQRGFSISSFRTQEGQGYSKAPQLLGPMARAFISKPPLVDQHEFQSVYIFEHPQFYTIRAALKATSADTLEKFIAKYPSQRLAVTANGTIVATKRCHSIPLSGSPPEIELIRGLSKRDAEGFLRLYMPQIE
ncbi:hypothetical protein JYT83_00440 [bacterium AH-315-F18]|nr:hypothetical protein [bacterium AH-315-F18]